MIFTEKLNQIQKREDEKMRQLYQEFKERTEFSEDIISTLDEMAYYTEEGKDNLPEGKYVSLEDISRSPH